MRTPHSLRGLAWTLPWLAAALLWVGVVQPLRAEHETRLIEQSRIRRDRVKAERTAREARALTRRVEKSLDGSCRAANDPASIRRSVVAATMGLDLSPVRLSATGGSDAGATIEASGLRPAVLELLRRLGSTRRGGFLRSVTIRMKPSRWDASIATGLLGGLPVGLSPTASCAAPSDPDPASLVEAFVPPSRIRSDPSPVAARAEIAPPVWTPAIEEPAPFTLVGFLRSEGRSRVSILVRGEVRVISVGDRVDGWTCIAIDPDEGAFFTSPGKPDLVLRAGAGY